MGKILSQSGISLADSYQIEGSIVGVEELQSRDVSLVHEMGATILSERLQSFFIRQTSGSLAASATWSVSTGELPDSPNRILGISVFLPLAEVNRISFCSISIQNGRTNREIPIFTWSLPDDDEIPVRWNDDGAGVAEFVELRSKVNKLPQLITRLGIGEAMPVIRFSGQVAAFGAGTVEAVAITHVCRANPEVPAAAQPSSHGLPLPSW